MVTFASLTPNIMVKDVNQTLDYYKNILGFEIVDTNPSDGELEWGFVKKGEAGLMFQEVSSLRAEYPRLSATPLGGAMTFYVLVQEQIESWFMNLEGKVKVVKELNTTFYGTKEFAIEDINGFILTFSQRKGAE
ncbi:MAG: VOC family protein [Saprospiraceae bacterium]|nr:VOC family protein [Saprospiraceae bacterium]